ncbi:dipeptidase [Pontibacter rugosus]|uniref:Dipeptidase n=1 Tax=Pontibacter rugosus TaxID=1745966 RepID=A0ABW3SWG7_9BACT
MNQPTALRLPIIDMHCDLLVYLSDVPGADMSKVEDIGCAAPALTEGNVKLQVMAIYSPTEVGSTRYAALQRDMFRQLTDSDNSLTAVGSAAQLQEAIQQPAKTGMVVAIENASGICEQSDELEEGFKRLEKIIETCGRVLYISLTHHNENRFGGGNNSTKGITRDGRMLLDYLHGRRIAIDMSHTSDALAVDILNHIDQERLDIPVIASHSNFRPIWHHERNLPDEITQEIILRKGLIGMNFLRKFVHTEDPDALLHHIQYGLANGAEDAICFGADYFYFADEKDKTRFPFYYKEHEQAGSSYSYLLERLHELLSPEQLQKLAYKNAQHFIERIWS